MRNQLLQLLIENRGRVSGAPIKAVVTGDSAVTFYLYGPIVATQDEADWWGGVAAETFVRELDAVKASHIALRVNSPGGDVFGTVAMMQHMREHPATITATVEGVAASAASVILTAADRVEIAPTSRVMIHRGWTFTVGNYNDHLAVADLLQGMDQDIAAAYASVGKLSAEEFLAAMDAETWYRAQESVDVGLVHALTTSSADNAQPGARAEWAMSAYKNAQQQPNNPAPAAARPTDDGRWAAAGRRLDMLARIAP